MSGETIKLNVHNGVYLSKNGEIAILELGEGKNPITKEVSKVVRVTAADLETGTEEIVGYFFMDIIEDVRDLALCIYNSDFLGEL